MPTIKDRKHNKPATCRLPTHHERIANQTTKLRALIAIMYGGVAVLLAHLSGHIDIVKVNPPIDIDWVVLVAASLLPAL